MPSNLTSGAAQLLRPDIKRFEDCRTPNPISREPTQQTFHSRASDRFASYATPPKTPLLHGAPTDNPIRNIVTERQSGGMDGGDQRRRQYDPSGYQQGYAPDNRVRTSSVANVPNVRGIGGDTPDRLRQAQLLTTRSSMPSALSAGATGPQDVQPFGYSQAQQFATPQLQAGPFAYQPEFTQDPQRQQQYPQYTPQVAYGLPQAPYESATQFPGRPPGNVDIMPTQFGVPQFFAQSGSSAAATLPQEVNPQYSTSTAQLQNPSSSFSPTTDLERSTLVSGYPTVESTSNAGPSAPAEPTESAESEQRPPDRFDFFYSQYRRALKETNENTSRGRLVEAGESLLELSTWLLGNVENLELTKDNQAIHGERLRLWRDFNYCWLAYLTRQLDDSRRILARGQSLAPGQRVLSKAALQNLGDELTKLCDGLEKAGLVDYEMGVWEEEIINLLLECRKIASSNEGDRQEASKQSSTSSKSGSKAGSKSGTGRR